MIWLNGAGTAAAAAADDDDSRDGVWATSIVLSIAPAHIFILTFFFISRLLRSRSIPLNFETIKTRPWDLEFGACIWLMCVCVCLRAGALVREFIKLALIWI